MSLLFTSLTLNAQTAFSELFDQTRVRDIQALRTLPGSFHQQIQKGKSYIYYNFRDAEGNGRVAYIGPESPRINELIERHNALKKSVAVTNMKALANACIALGCMPTLTKHFRIINRLDQYGFFQSGGILIGTHAFLVMGNMLGISWVEGNRTMDVDFAHAGKNISIALGANVKISVHDAITSLEMGLLPITMFSGNAGAQYRNIHDPELRIDFVTSETRKGGMVHLPNLGLSLESLKFMEYSMEDPIQSIALSVEGACIVNIPRPERYAIHKLIVSGERPTNEMGKSNKDLAQAAAIIQAYLHYGRGEELNLAWENAIKRGPGWRKRVASGLHLLKKQYPMIDILKTS